MSKPKFFQAVLQEVEGDVLAFVYPHVIASIGRGNPKITMTMAERMGTEEALCPECGQNHWWLMPTESSIVREGGKPYIECLNCGYQTHL